MGSRKSSSTTPGNATIPSSSVRSAVSIWLVLHLALLATSLSAVVATSVLQDRLLSIAAYYLTPLQLRADGRPIYLTHGAPADQTHRVEWLREGSSVWDREAVHGYRGSERLRRYSRFAKVIAAAAEREETAAASLLALPLVRQEMQRSAEGELPLPVRMRIVRLAPDLTSPVYPSEPVATARWEAAIVREPTDSDEAPRWSVVTVKERRLNAEAAPESSPESTPQTPAASPPRTPDATGENPDGANS